MTKLRFEGGVGSIGSSKVIVEDGGFRVLLDLGDAIPGERGFLMAPIASRPGSELRDRLRVSEAPWIPHLYRPGAVGEMGPEAGGDGRTVLFLSHCHIDHVGLIGWVAEDVPIFASPDTVRMLDALETAGQQGEGGPHHVQALAEDEPIQVGPMTVVRYAVDHDVDGASGFAVHTTQGTVAYSGDLRLHGRHPELSARFAHRVRGAAALVIEGTMLSSDMSLPMRDEWAVDRLFSEALARTPGLVLMSLYPRDIERVRAFLELAAQAHRRVLWPEPMARFLSAYGVAGVETYLPQQSSAEARQNPAGFVIQIAMESLPDILDLPTGPGSLFLHANGEPLGPFQPSWQLLQHWLQLLDVPFRSIGSSGHAAPDDLHWLIAEAAPATVYPLHTADPFRLMPPPGTVRVLPRYGKEYPLVPIPGRGPTGDAGSSSE